MDRKEMLEKLDASFNRLQDLQIKPTLPNMEILVATEYDLRDIYEALKKEEAGNGRDEADPGE